MDTPALTRHLYGDQDGRWVILTVGEGVSPPLAVEVTGPGPDIPLPGRVHRLLALGALRDAGMAADDAGLYDWVEDVKARYATVHYATDGDLLAYLRPKVRHLRMVKGIRSVGGWVVALDHVELYQRFPKLTTDQLRTALAKLRDES